MSTNASKLENDLCRCCHSEGSYKNLYTSNFLLNGEKVVYANVVRECFNVELLQMQDLSQHVLCTICSTCIQRLEDAVKFKRQIQKCEKRFQHVYSGCVNKDNSSEVTIKEEKLEPEEYILSASDTWPNGTDSGVPDDGNSADNDDDHTCDGDMDCNPKNEEDMSKLGKWKKTKKTPAKVKKKPVPVKDEDVLEILEGGIKVIKRPSIKRNVDYKATVNGYECLKCQLIFKSVAKVKDHVRSDHLYISKYTCPHCSGTFDSIATFTKHKLNEHDIDDRFKCNACEQAFNTKVQLNKHKNTFHMLGVKIKCKDCDYETFSNEALYKHKFRHKTVKDYQCKYCKKAFLRKATLRLHERIHTGDRRKVCSVCGQAFVQKASLNYHMTRYHPEVAY